MSTNYYLVPKKNQQNEINEIVNAIKTLISFAQKQHSPFFLTNLNLVEAEIHLGQYANGWVFICDHNDWKYYKTVDEFKEFIKRGNIINEYGMTIHFDDFWKMATETKGTIRGDLHNEIYFHETSGFC